MSKNRIEKEILGQIQNRKIRMKPRWWFQILTTGIRGIWLLMVLAAAISISIIAYFIETYNPVELVEYGDVGNELFVVDFPYIWLVGAIIFFVSGAILLSKLGSNYKKPTKKIILTTSILITLMTLGLILIKSLF